MLPEAPEVIGMDLLMDTDGEPMNLRPAQPMSPAGMVRISNGSRQRCIWPVHLSGWVALGWQVDHNTPIPEWDVAAPAKPEAAAPINPPPPEPTDAMGAAPTAEVQVPQAAVPPEQAQRRGRKAKAVDAAQTAANAAPAASGYALPDDLLNAEF